MEQLCLPVCSCRPVVVFTAMAFAHLAVLALWHATTSRPGRSHEWKNHWKIIVISKGCGYRLYPLFPDIQRSGQCMDDNSTVFSPVGQ